MAYYEARNISYGILHMYRNLLVAVLLTFGAIRLATCHFIDCTVGKYVENACTRGCTEGYHLEVVEKKTVCTTPYITLYAKFN